MHIPASEAVQGVVSCLVPGADHQGWGIENIRTGPVVRPRSKHLQDIPHQSHFIHRTWLLEPGGYLQLPLSILSSCTNVSSLHSKVCNPCTFSSCCYFHFGLCYSQFRFCRFLLGIHLLMKKELISYSCQCSEAGEAWRWRTTTQLRCLRRNKEIDCQRALCTE